MANYKEVNLTDIPYSNPANSQQYSDDILAAGGWPQTPNNEALINAWVNSESATFPGWNGMGTSLELPGSTPVPGNSANVQEYPTLDSGLTAAIDMMKGLHPQTTALTPDLNKDLAAGNTSLAQMAVDLGNSGWDGSNGDAYDENAVAGKLGLGTLTQPTGATTANGPSGQTSTTSATSSTDGGTPASSAAGAVALTGPASLLQTISDLMNPGGIKGGIGGLLSGSTEASIAQNVEAFGVRLFFAAGFLALAYIGVKTMTTGSGGGRGSTSIISLAQRREGIDLANRNLASGEANRQTRLQQEQIKSDNASAQRQHEADQARRERTAATRAANRDAANRRAAEGIA